MVVEMSTAERPLRPRSSSLGSSRRGRLQVDTAYETSPKRRMKRLVLGKGQQYPGQDNVDLSPRPSANTNGTKASKRIGKRITQQDQEAGVGSIFRTGKERHTAKKRLNHRQPQQLLHHVDAECGFHAQTDHYNDRSQARERLKYNAETTLTRQEDEPIGLTIDENLYVTNVVQGTAAHAAGLNPGTRLATVDGVNVTTQAQAIGVLKQAGSEVRIGLAQDTSAKSMKLDGVIAGVPTSSPVQPDRRVKRASATSNMFLNRPAPYGSDADRGSPHPKPAGLGPPGLGPRTTDWTDSEKPFAYQPPGSDTFKPNLYTPSLSRSTTPRRMANKTSYEICEDKGEGEGFKSPRQARGRQRVDGAENRNGDIITNDPVRHASVSPRPKGKDRGASPAAVRNAASGAPVGDEYTRATGRKQSNVPENTVGLLRYDGGEWRANHSQRSVSAGATPRRMGGWTPAGSGDIIGHQFGPVPPLPSPKGIRRGPANYDLPKPKARDFTPTSRHMVAQPLPSDIFSQRTYRGGNQDFLDNEYAAHTRGGSPRNTSRVEIGFPQQRSVMREKSPDPTTPRKGKGTGTMAPRQPPQDYSPWGDRA